MLFLEKNVGVKKGKKILYSYDKVFEELLILVVIYDNFKLSSLRFLKYLKQWIQTKIHGLQNILSSVQKMGGILLYLKTVIMDFFFL